GRLLVALLGDGLRDGAVDVDPGDLGGHGVGGVVADLRVLVRVVVVGRTGGDGGHNQGQSRDERTEHGGASECGGWPPADGRRRHAPVREQGSGRAGGRTPYRRSPPRPHSNVG